VRAPSPQDVILDTALDLVPGFERFGTRFERSYATFDLHRPGVLGIRVRRTVEAGQQFGWNLGACFHVKSESVGKDCFSGLGHVPILRFGVSSNKRVCSKGIVNE
jgi:hypothetical protein